MGVVYLNDSTLTDIASAIRYQEGSSTTFLPSEMAGAIRNLNTSTDVDIAIVPELNMRDMVIDSPFVLSTSLPQGATIINRCDICDESISKPAFLYMYKYPTGSAYEYGIYSPVNNVDNIGIISMASSFQSRTRLPGSAISTRLTYNMSSAYASSWIAGTPACGNLVKNFSGAYQNCQNLTGPPVCGESVTEMGSTYANCRGLTGPPACGPNVINMVSAYNNCVQLTGSPACGPNVVNMAYAYVNCRSLTGPPTCGPNVNNMHSAYYRCSELSGNPANTYADNLCYTYYGCPNIYGDMYLLNTSSSITVNMNLCFNGRNNQRMLNIHVGAGSAFNSWIYSRGTLINATKVAWTTMEGGYYNTMHNIYVYYDL